jgi:hypothetical protein
LLANIRGMILSARWPKPDVAIDRLNQTWGDRLSDALPSFLWPKTRILCYVLASVEILFLLIALFAPRKAL